MSDQDLAYSGPEKEYKPQPGSNSRIVKNSDLYGRNPNVSLDNLKSDIAHILNRCTVVLGKCGEELSQFSMDLGVSEKRQEAANAVWSNFSSSSVNTVSYNQLIELEKRNDRSSRFLLNELTKELRKPSGSSAQEIKKVAQIIYDEALKINNLINSNFFGSTTTAETALIESLLDFTSSTKKHVYRLDSFFNVPRKERNHILPKKEVDPLTPQEATQYQSIFLLNVNGLNEDIDRDIDYMNKFFVNSSDFFYKKIIAPLTQLENEIPNLRTLGQDGNRLNDWTINVTAAIDRNFATALYDVVDRAEKFSVHLSNFEEKVSLRENYLSYIRQLEQKGKKSQSTLVEGLGESNFSLKDNSQQFINNHNSLSDLDDGQAHQQYLMKYNDYLRGDLSFSEFATIDSVDLSHHTHDGEDGSKLIDGKSIEQNSITTDLIEYKYEDKPKNLSLINFSGSQTEVNAKFFWLTKNNNTINELQISKLQDIDFVDPGQEEPEQPEVPRIPGYIPPFESYDPLYIEWITQIDYELFFN